jgi:hypothetical protein
MSNNAEIDLIQLNDIGISPGKALFQVECCAWCMDEQKHANGKILEAKEGDSNTSHPVIWDEASVSITNILDSIHEDEAAEYGAEAIALILSVLKSDYNSVKRASKKGGGYDYWLGHKDGFLFQERVRLEISGIRAETRSNSLQARVKDKMRQVAKSDGTYPSCIIVVEFSKFVARIVWQQ